MQNEVTYQGSCHCGKVTYKVTMPPPTVGYACNCSICSRAGWLLTFVKPDAFQLMTGADDLSDYQFAQKRTHHVFCRTCGVRPFSRGTAPDGSPSIAVNLRCLDDIDLSTLTIQNFDGKSL